MLQQTDDILPHTSMYAYYIIYMGIYLYMAHTCHSFNINKTYIYIYIYIYIIYIYTVYALIFAWFNICRLEAIRESLDPRKFRSIGLLCNGKTWPSANIKTRKSLKDKIREIYTPRKLKRIRHIYIYIYTVYRVKFCACMCACASIIIISSFYIISLLLYTCIINYIIITKCLLFIYNYIYICIFGPLRVIKIACKVHNMQWNTYVPLSVQY